MKIEIENADGVSTVVLGDDASRIFISDFSAYPVRKVQVNEGVRSKNVKVFPRKNRRYDITFSVAQHYESYAAAQSAYRDNDGNIADKGTLVVTEEGTISNYKNAALQTAIPTLVGETIFWKYHFTAESVEKDKFDSSAYEIL